MGTAPPVPAHSQTGGPHPDRRLLDVSRPLSPDIPRAGPLASPPTKTASATASAGPAQPRSASTPPISHAAWLAWRRLFGGAFHVLTCPWFEQDIYWKLVVAVDGLMPDPSSGIPTAASSPSLWLAAKLTHAGLTSEMQRPGSAFFLPSQPKTPPLIPFISFIHQNAPWAKRSFMY